MQFFAMTLDIIPYFSLFTFHFSLKNRRRHHTFHLSPFTFHFFLYLCAIMRTHTQRAHVYDTKRC